MERNPNRPGLPRKEQQRAGRAEMLATPFEKIEQEIRSQLARMLGPGGFDAKRDILAITVNRWAHGYAYTYDTLGDPEVPESERPHVLGRRAFGRIAIANADAGAAAFTNVAIDQAQRAVQDCLLRRLGRRNGAKAHELEITCRTGFPRLGGKVGDLCPLTEKL
jgi:spermidine dehydrogenase